MLSDEDIRAALAKLYAPVARQIGILAQRNVTIPGPGDVLHRHIIHAILSVRDSQNPQYSALCSVSLKCY